MNRRKLGRTDLQVSDLCLGTRNFGWHTDHDAAFDVLDAFHRDGGNFIQACGVAADDASDASSTGVSESYIGRWLKARGIPRNELVIASRIAIPPTAGRTDLFKTASAIRRSCEDSLRRLQVRYLDLLVFEWREDMPMDEVLLATETLVRAGMVRHTAASGFPAWRVMEWAGQAARRNLSRLEAMQNEFSLVSNAGVNADALSLACAHRLGFIARAPLAGGFLAGRYSNAGEPDRARERMLRGRFTAASAEAALEEVQAIACARRTTPSRVALAWALAHAGVSSALIGVTSAAQLADLVGATTLDLSLSDIQRLDWRWKITDGNPPDDENEPPAAADAAVAINFNNISKLETEKLHA